MANPWQIKGGGRWLSLALLTGLHFGCASHGGGGEEDPPPCTGPQCADPSWAAADVFGVPNLDDDDGNDTIDFAQSWWAGDDEPAQLVLAAADLAAVADGETITLSLSGAVDAIAIYVGAERLLGAGAGTSVVLPTALIAGDGEGASDLVLHVSFGDYAARGLLHIAHQGPAGESITTGDVVLQAAPLVMNHHLQPAERVWVVDVGSNDSMVAAFSSALGSAFTAIDGDSVGSDVWVQDEYEFASLVGAGGERIDVIIDSIRNRGLDVYKDVLVGDGSSSFRQTWGNPAERKSYDSFGNLEASPPVTVGGIQYPFGRIYYGREDGVGLNATLAGFLASQKVQAPFELPTRWLCVGHVDEFSSFLPDPSSAKGFKLLLSDVPSAWALLQSLPSNHAIPLYNNDHGYATAGEILGDAALVALNNTLQQDKLDVIRARFKTELGLSDDDIILVPSLFETVGGCNGRVAALIPGMVNLSVARLGNVTHVFTADPFFRNVADQAADPVIGAFLQRMPAGLTWHFVDDWDTYHMNLGEVHCGSNVRRTPVGGWWTNTKELLGW